MKCFVTGAGGFIGAHLVEYLLATGHIVCASDLQPCRRFEDQQAQELHFVALNLLSSDISQLLAAFQPDLIFHLAAQSLPNRSWDEPLLTFDVNVRGTIRLLDAVRAVAPRARVLIVTSSAVYAPRNLTEPITEDAPLHPITPYGISKLAQDHTARLYGERYGLAIIRARPFYLIGPGKVGDVCSDFARGIVAVERKTATELGVGNLEVVRDFLDVRDGVAALAMLAERGQPGEVYNVSSGRGYRIGEILDRLRGMTHIPVAIQQEPARVRPLDEPVKIADNRRLLALGWRPRIELDTTLRDILEYWRNLPPSS